MYLSGSCLLDLHNFSTCLHIPTVKLWYAKFAHGKRWGPVSGSHGSKRRKAQVCGASPVRMHSCCACPATCTSTPGGLPRQMEAQKQSMLVQILSQEAKERLNRIKLVKPERAAAIENKLIGMARGGRLPGKITEAQLIDLLEGAGGAGGAPRVLVCDWLGGPGTACRC